MKISTYLITLLIIGGILFVVTIMVQEGSDKYDVSINQSNWENKYDYANSINSSVGPLKTSLENIQDENTGWFSKITEGLSAIPRAVILLPALVFFAFTVSGELATGILTSISLPSYLIFVAVIIFTIWGIFKLMEIYQRWEI